MKIKNSPKINTLAHWLILIGLTRRSLALFFMFLLVFVVGTLLFLVVYNSLGTYVWLLSISPLIILDLFFGYILFSPNMKKLMKEIEEDKKTTLPSCILSQKKVAWRKVNIIMACWGTFIVIGIILVTFLVVLGMIDKIEICLYLYCTIGLLIVFLLFWPFYSKRLK